MLHPQTSRSVDAKPVIFIHRATECNQEIMAIFTAGHDSELRSVQPIMKWNKRDAFEGRGLGVALVDEVLILVVSGQEGANKKESAMCARND